jgi:catecholate siderophore receptor
MRRSICFRFQRVALVTSACAPTAFSLAAVADPGATPPASPTPLDEQPPAPAAPSGSPQTATPTPSGSEPTAPSLSPVTVTGVRTLLHDKLSEDLQSTPQSITVVTNQLMTSQADNRLQDALKNVPGITLNAGEGAARGDTVNLRGFSAFNDFFLDGIRDAAVYNRDSFDLDSVEVVEGPSAVLFGRGSTGGAINQVTKAPLLATFEQIDAQIGSNDLYRATADLNAPMGSAAAVRLNLMGESSAVAERDGVRNRRWGVAPALGLGIGTQDSFTLAYLHQQEDDVPDVGVPFVDGRPASVPPVARAADFGLASDRTTSDVDIFTARYKHDFNEDLSIADTLRYANYQFDYQFDSPNFGASPPPPGEPLSTILVGRDAPDSSGVQTNLDEQIDLTAHFETRFIAHTLVTGIELARQSSNIDRYLNPFNSNNAWIAETPLLAPDPNEGRPVEPISSVTDIVAPSGGVYLIDTAGFGPYVDLVGGYRYDYFSADYRQLTVASAARLHLDELNRVGSPRAALLIKPTPRQTYYLSYGTSFDPSAEALTLTTKTAGLGPVKATSYEAGTKTEWLDGGLLLTAALFHTEVDNAQTNDPDNPNITVLNGNERVNGFEVGATGYLTKHWELYSGYIYLDGRTLASGTPADVGKVMPNTAHHALNLWTEYEFSDAWEIGGGGNWLSGRYADSAEAAYVPGYVVWNAMAAYRLSSKLRFQLNGSNLFNKLYYGGLYYTSVSENHAIPGPGRSVLLSVHLSL